ncbi:hypothetical protein PoB_002719200 [Plakobranchus ocellatus]|uniref:Uncharacterized protein n=1 Tax=Plakobranchus ocellatus TaxID=259542 RepID=A0AAV4A1D2_9GAST|nr:hypothetical protein PoB_002719200 [Plakobranchus ocellatus]
MSEYLQLEYKTFSFYVLVANSTLQQVITWAVAGPKSWKQPRHNSSYRTQILVANHATAGDHLGSYRTQVLEAALTQQQMITWAVAGPKSWKQPRHNRRRSPGQWQDPSPGSKLHANSR